jgi:hypothetical protein
MCNLTPVPGDIPCHFRGTAGNRSTLVLNGTNGTILFGETTYAGHQLVAPGDTATQLIIDIEAGTKALSILYLFSLGAAGRGELQEDCGDGTTRVLRTDLRGDQPFVSYDICGGAA